MQRTHHALWLAPLLGLVGLLSYFTVFAAWPVTRDLPLLNLALVAIAAGLGAVGLVGAWRAGGWRVAAGLGSFVVSAGAAALLFVYVFSLSYGLPDASEGLALGAPIPSVQLVGLDGESVVLDASDSGRKLLVFYRGHW